MDTPATLVDRKEFISPPLSPTVTIHDGEDRRPDLKELKDAEKQIETVASEEAVTGVVDGISKTQRYFSVFIVCFAQFFDIFASGSTIIAVPSIAEDLNFTSSETQWIMAAYTLTFASFQLVGGRLSDIFHPKPVFISGCFIMGIMAILCAVSIDPIMLLVFRAFQGIGAAFTVPSALALIVQTIPDPQAQSKALACFGSAGAVGNAFGFVLGGVITSKINWQWVFYLTAIMVLCLCIPAIFILPKGNAGQGDRKLDLPGVGALTGGLILLVYAISDASNVGWAKPQIIVCLIFSVIFILAFLYIETKVADPAVPPRVWSTPNVLPLFVYALSIYWSLYVSELQLVEVFQDLWGWSALNASLHCIPFSVSGGLVNIVIGIYGPRMPKKLMLGMGQLLMGIAAVLFALGDTPGKYWSHTFLGMFIGQIGTGTAYVGTTVAVMASARKGEEGVVGALVNTAFQLGATVGLAIASTIVVSVNDKLPADAALSAQFIGYQDGFWSLVVLQGIAGLVAVIFLH